ncbi:MAG: hypothetical protein WBX15_02030 [Thermoanaerobaculia bacterium]
MIEGGLEEKTLVFDRTPIGRLVSCAAAFGAAALFFQYLGAGLENVEPLPLAGLGFLLIGTILAALLQYGDHIYIGPEGLLYENRWVRLVGRRAAWIRWEEVVEIREIRRKILVLFSRDGRRVFVDAINGYRFARAEILRRAPHAAITGTLERRDREEMHRGSRI